MEVERDNTRGIAGAGLGLGIAGTALGVLGNNGLGNILGGWETTAAAQCLPGKESFPTRMLRSAA